MTDMKECCGTCKYHFYGLTGMDKGWYCNNDECENYGIETKYSDSCEEWEEK